MSAKPIEVSDHGLRIVGIIVASIGITINLLVMFWNIGYVVNSFGAPVLAAYISAAASVITLPILLSHIGPERELSFVKTVSVIFCSWISLEETVHAMHGWHAPQAAQMVAEAVVGPAHAQTVTMMMFGALLYAVIEGLGHLVFHGVDTAREAHSRIKAAK